MVSPRLWAAAFHPGDGPRVQEALRAYFACDTTDYQVEFVQRATNIGQGSNRASMSSSFTSTRQQR